MSLIFMTLAIKENKGKLTRKRCLMGDNLIGDLLHSYKTTKHVNISLAYKDKLYIKPYYSIVYGLLKSGRTEWKYRKTCPPILTPELF
jgi:hypothetical protein